MAKESEKVMLKALILSSLKDVKERLEILLTPFKEPGSTFLNSRRQSVIDDISTLARESTELIQPIERQREKSVDYEPKIYYEPIMLYNYIQGITRYCYCLTYGLDPKSERMWDQADEAFNQAEQLAELLNDSRIKADIDSKKIAIYPQLASDWASQKHSLRKVDIAIELLQWLINYYKESAPNQAQSFTESLIAAQQRRKKVEAEETESNELEKSAPLWEVFIDNLRLDNHQIWALGFGTFGIVLFLTGQWMISLICIGIAWFLWKGDIR